MKNISPMETTMKVTEIEVTECSTFEQAWRKAGMTRQILKEFLPGVSREEVTKEFQRDGVERYFVDTEGNLWYTTFLKLRRLIRADLATPLTNTEFRFVEIHIRNGKAGKFIIHDREVTRTEACFHSRRHSSFAFTKSNI